MARLRIGVRLVGKLQTVIHGKNFSPVFSVTGLWKKKCVSQIKELVIAEYFLVLLILLVILTDGSMSIYRFDVRS